MLLINYITNFFLSFINIIQEMFEDAVYLLDEYGGFSESN
jgi:hypothetical protein